jgi:hypothetical protein
MITGYPGDRLESLNLAAVASAFDRTDTRQVNRRSIIPSNYLVTAIRQHEGLL